MVLVVGTNFKNIFIDTRFLLEADFFVDTETARGALARNL